MTEMVLKRSHRGVGMTGRRLFYFPELKRCIRRNCGRGLTERNVTEGRWCSRECAGLVEMIPQQRAAEPEPSAPLWRNTDPNRREHLDLPRTCRRRDGTPKLAYRTQGQAIAAAIDLAHHTGRGEPDAFWCVHHAAWHLGNRRDEESAT